MQMQCWYDYPPKLEGILLNVFCSGLEKQGFVTGQIRVKDTWVDGSRDARPTKEVEELDIEVDEVDAEDSSEIIR